MYMAWCESNGSEMIVQIVNIFICTRSCMTIDIYFRNKNNSTFTTQSMTKIINNKSTTVFRWGKNSVYN